MTALSFDAVRHEYRLDGMPVPSVTQVIDFLNDYAGVNPAALEVARARGEAVHLATALDDNNDLDESSVDPIVMPYLVAWHRFKSETQFVCELIETRVYSDRYRYAGTPDRYGYFPSRRYSAVLDLKTTAQIMPATGPQTAAYAAALVENGFAKKPRRFTVQLRTDSSYRLIEHDDAADLSVFLSALTLYNWRKKHGIEA